MTSEPGAPAPVDPVIDPSWKAVLRGAFDDPGFLRLRGFLKREKAGPVPVYPPGRELFAAFDRTPFEDVKVVVLGQDPYHGPGQANGLCFSVNPGVRKPPSLNNIFKEIHDDLGLPIPEHGDLGHWADQGVLLLNATLTVRAHQAGSHHGQGWEAFTDAAVRALSEQRRNLVFLLWGSKAKAKAAIVDRTRHHVLTAAHPSPLSAHNGFFGCRHFSKTNATLEKLGLPPIDWSLGPARDT